ncbi:hypothetical protein RB653_001348 [Dictyostelium firmibasis]|uniref:Uncharacterized protein n=1 Tax=Dictyostelium firmibasis TaxID=79012 RepID=A0AAN7YYL4_9MYCE
MSTSNNNNNNNNYKVWFITGVTGGSGSGLASRLLELGHKVAGTSRNKDKLNSTDLIKNNNFLGLQVDLANESNVKNSIEETIKKFGRIDVIVNNAGQSIFGSVEEITDKEQRLLMDVLYFGPCNVIRSVLPHFRERKTGLIFNISSVFGGSGCDSCSNVPFFSGYCAGKAAIHTMTECLREEVKPFDIKVCSIILGYLKTSFSNPLTINQIKDYNLKEKANEIMKMFQRNNPEQPINFANFVIENSKLSNLPPTIHFGKNPYHSNSNSQTKPSYPHQKLKAHQDAPKQFEKDIPDLPELTDGNIHMPYILHE